MRVASLRSALSPGFGMIRKRLRPIGTHDSRTSQNPIVAKKIPKMRLQHGWHQRCKIAMSLC
jgi:hypothetical protein